MIAIYIIRNNILSSYLINSGNNEYAIEESIRPGRSVESTRLLIDNSTVLKFLQERNPENYPAIVVYDYQPRLVSLISESPTKINIELAEEVSKIFNSKFDFKEGYLEMKKLITVITGKPEWKTMKDIPKSHRN